PLSTLVFHHIVLENATRRPEHVDDMAQKALIVASAFTRPSTAPDAQNPALRHPQARMAPSRRFPAPVRRAAPHEPCAGLRLRPLANHCYGRPPSSIVPAAGS